MGLRGRSTLLHCCVPYNYLFLGMQTLLVQNSNVLTCFLGSRSIYLFNFFLESTVFTCKTYLCFSELFLGILANFLVISLVAYHNDRKVNYILTFITIHLEIIGLHIYDNDGNYNSNFNNNNSNGNGLFVILPQRGSSPTKQIKLIITMTNVNMLTLEEEQDIELVILM